MTRDSAPCQKWAKRVVFCCSFKYYGRRETLEEGLLRCISHGRCRTRDVPIRHVRSQGADFLRRVAFGASDLQVYVCQDDDAWQVQHFVWPGLILLWQAQYIAILFERVQPTSANRIVTVISLTCQICRKPHRKSFQLPNLNSVSRKNCGFQLSTFEFVFQLWTSTFEGSLAELLGVWRCKLQKLRKSCRSAPLLMLLPLNFWRGLAVLLRFGPGNFYFWW